MIMDTKENQNEENNVDVATSSVIDQPNANTDTNTVNSNISSGLQQIEDDNDMPLPMGMAEVISNRAEPPKQIGKVEQLDDDDDGPAPPVATLEASLNLSEHEDSIAKKKAKDEMNQKLSAASTNTNDEEVMLPPLDRDSINIPSMEIIEGGDVPDNTNTGRGDTNRRGWDDIGSSGINTRMAVPNNDIESGNDEIISREVSSEEDIHIPIAWKVDDDDNEEDYDKSVDEEVYIATPTIPWWKQGRFRILLGVVILLGALAVALGVSLSISSNNISPQTTNAPTPTPTYKCFGADDGGRDGILYNAVRVYVLQGCANDTECIIGQTYGWPMNSWCVGSVKDMSYLFGRMDNFNEDINGWNTSSVTDMRFM